MIDLRSDTVTKPTEPMRRAIAMAEVGDDVFGDDALTSELERKVADLLGKEAALFVPSGTMSNQLAVRLQTQPGDETILEANSHIYSKEAGGTAALSGVICRTIQGQRGIFRGEEIETAIRTHDIHHAPARLVCIENTHNSGAGAIWPLEAIEDVAKTAKRHGLSLHLDGARIWNASVATGIGEREYARHFDTVSVCFSKGLGAPIGSALAGSHSLIDRGRRFRKMFGGGMRQTGILAAAAIYALDHHRARLADDHANARILAKGLTGLPGIEIDADSVETNIVFFRLTHASAPDLVTRLQAVGVAVMAMGPTTVRAVTNLMVNGTQTRDAVEILRRTIGSAATRIG